ncbi:MAG: hypothetical protein JSS79_10440 [Bacteroidetes bacterium]|nr:hypothetical protein [Bacteroidota bacterium]
MTNEIIKKIDWTPKWDGGAPMPQVFSNGHRVFLIYMVANWDEESIKEFKSLDSEEGNEEYLALVEFNGHTFRFGIANDEVFQGLPYYKQGLEWAHIIENSKWIEEIKQIHKVHPYYNELRWTKLNHYLLLFKDEILEVIGTGYSIEIFRTSYNRMGQEVIRRMSPSASAHL